MSTRKLILAYAIVAGMGLGAVVPVMAAEESSPTPKAADTTPVGPSSGMSHRTPGESNAKQPANDSTVQTGAGSTKGATEQGAASAK